jgi:lysophospholipase L1-like esterase
MFLLPAPQLATAGDDLAIVAFGTSLTARGDWQADLADRLGACTDAVVEVHTIALGGANSNWALEHLDEVVALSPDVVLVEFSINDASLLHGVSAHQSRANTERIITSLQALIPHVKVVLMTMNPASGLRWLSRPFLDDFYRIYRDLAEERRVALADLAPRWEVYDGRELAMPDGLHPTPEAARAVIVPELLQLLGCRSDAAANG